MNDESNALQPADKIPRWDIGEYGQCTLNRKNGRFVEFLDYKAALAQIESLTRERDANLNSWGKERYELMAERDTLRAALDAAKADAERLDWLQANPRLSEMHIDGKIVNCYAYAIAWHSKWTLRELIDTARPRGETEETK